MTNSLSYVDILKVSDQIILLCLQFDVNCQDLINIQDEYKRSVVPEEEFKKAVYTVLA